MKNPYTLVGRTNTKLLFFILFSVMFRTNAQNSVYLMREDYNPSVSVYEDDNGRIGIGQPSTDSKLDVWGDAMNETTTLFLHRGPTGPDNHFVAMRHLYAIPPAPSVDVTDFIIKGSGFTGIGIADPQAYLHIKPAGWGGSYSNELSYASIPWQPVWVASDDNDGFIGGLFNTGNEDPGLTGGYLAVAGNAEDHDKPALAVVSNDGSFNTTFAVAGDGTIASGFDLTEDAPIAQVDIRPKTQLDNLFNIGVQSPNSHLAIFRIDNSGRVGIGTAPTTSTLTIRGGDNNNDNKIDLIASQNNNRANAIRFMNYAGTLPRHIITEADGDFVIDPGIPEGGGNDVVLVKGRLNVGDDRPRVSKYPDWQLGVDGDIIAKRVIVQISDWEDKVFENDYPLATLEEVEAFIKTNKHLPEIPAECEVADNGIDVGEMNKLLLKKVEELTLHAIAQQKQINELKTLLTK